MNIMAEQIKQQISIEQVLSRYHLESGRNHIMRCPFHEDSTPSLKIYVNSNTFYCFGCCVGGDVISFIMHLFKLDFSGALIRIEEDFGLSLNRCTDYRSKEKAKKALLEHQEKLLKEQAEEECYKIVYEAVSGVFRRMWQDYLTKRPNAPDEPLDPDFVRSLHNLEPYEYWLDQYNTFEKWEEAFN